MRETPNLRDVPIFKHLDADERTEFEELLEPANFEAGQMIFDEGSPEERLYVITSGTVEVHKSVLPGRRQRLATIEAPTVVGEMGLLTEPRAAASVEAMTRVEAHGVGRDRLLEMLDADSPSACKLVYEIGRTLAERMAATNETVAEVISRLENAAARGSEDIDVFRDQLVQDWGF
ncbi:MAG: cyclic nucleotide-binding domain-containing protein [Actinomycetota bacterium]|jgi:CRP-like cAMP-binding protein|nr:cyclic nucleotide-binding domain-containing protein [Actinomycetota bacterium]